MTDYNLSIVVFSCDAYSDLWDGFFEVLDYYWKDRTFQCYLVNNEKAYERDGVYVINAGNYNWSARARVAANLIQSKYILTFLDDYYVSEQIINDKIKEVLHYIKKEKISYYQLDITDKEDYGKWSNFKLNYIYDIPKSRLYWVDTSIAIWDKYFFLELIGEGDYSAWEFELARNLETKTPEEYADKICVFDSRLLISMTPMVIQGKYFPKAIKIMKKKGHIFDLSKRKVMSCNEVYKHELKRYFSKLKFGREFAKIIGRLIGYKFMSDDYEKKVKTLIK